MEDITNEDPSLEKESKKRNATECEADFLPVINTASDKRRKVHLATAADVMDHCITYALSSEEACFRTECDHSHRIRGQGCLSLRNTLDDIIKWADESEWENKDSVLFKVEKAVADIVSLQKHHVRSKNQELYRNQIVSNMTENDVFITCDWAMKFLPRKFREGQLDWFGKRGINWHISVSLTKLDTKFHTQTHIHNFNEQTAQDAHVTAAVISDVVSDLRRTVPNMQNVHLLVDNAGCYKSSSTILSFKESIPEINTFNFSESQNGKGPCDRKASHAKAAIKRYINEGRDVTSAEDMKKSMQDVQEDVLEGSNKNSDDKASPAKKQKPDVEQETRTRTKETRNKTTSDQIELKEGMLVMAKWVEKKKTSWLEAIIIKILANNKVRVRYSQDGTEFEINKEWIRV